MTELVNNGLFAPFLFPLLLPALTFTLFQILSKNIYKDSLKTVLFFIKREENPTIEEIDMR